MKTLIVALVAVVSASAFADKVYLNPQGSIDFRGMCMQTLFYKGL